MPIPEIESKVKQIIVDELGVDANEVTPNARSSTTWVATLWIQLNLSCVLKRNSASRFLTKTPKKIQSVRDAYNYIDQHKKVVGHER